MPFTLRTVQPVHVSRTKLTGADGKPRVQDHELEAVFNNTLCNAIRQLASLVAAAEDVFGSLNLELRAVTERATGLQERIGRVRDRVEASDPRLVTVPEGDLCAFAALPRERHFRPEREARVARDLFVAATRPDALRRLYDAAARPALGGEALAQLDRLRRDGTRSSTLFLCTPTLGRGRAGRLRSLRSKVVDIDIETRKPASLLELRKWTSTEALGDVTVHPDCTVRIASEGLSGLSFGTPAEEVDGQGGGPGHGEVDDGDATLRHDQTDHLLPTTEEQVKAIADRFPAEVVRVDVTGRSFHRMARCRRSLLRPAEAEAAEAVRRRPRRQRSRRRNTLAGTDQREIEEALHGDRTGGGALSTVDDIVLSSSTMLSGKGPREASADFKTWAFNSLRRWGRSRFRAHGAGSQAANANASGASIAAGELHAADPVDDINVYETVAGKRRGAGTIPISAGLSGPMSLAVKLREGGLGGLRRLKALDEPPHSSSGNWSASSESGRASVNSDSSHQPKSSTCSSILPHRRRFVNTSTSSSVTSEGTLTPEDMAAVHFMDEGETSSAGHPGAAQLWYNMMDLSISDASLSAKWNEKVYSCDTEGYYTSFHMDSGLKTLKEEEVGAGLSLPPTPMHSTSALSNCSSGRGSASLAQLTAESEYELFGKGSTSTTASSAGTVCTTLLVDNSKGCDNSNGSDRSLSRGPAVPERKSSLTVPCVAVPCLAQDCPPCSTVVALIHNTSQAHQGHSPRSASGDSPDSGRNTSSSPVESVSCQQDAETDAFISPLPSITSEMEFSECSDFEGTDRIERIRVKTTINTSRIPSMCAITPPQSDDETCTRQASAEQNLSERGAFPLPSDGGEDNRRGERNDNHSYSLNTDKNANKPVVDNNFNARPTTPVTKPLVTSIIHVDKRSGYATVHTLDNAFRENNNNQKVRPPSPSGGTLFINPSVEEMEPGNHSHQQPLIRDSLIPFSSILSKFRKASNLGRKLPPDSATSTNAESADNNDESGEYVTITDVRNNNKPNVPAQCTPQRSEVSEPACESPVGMTWESQEYVSLNELPVSTPKDFQPSSILSGSSSESSLERKKRQGARVTLDSEGKVVYSSDSLRRRKGAHTTFAPGQYVKDTTASPSPSPVANHRMPKTIIRPVHSQASGGNSQDCNTPIKSNMNSNVPQVVKSNGLRMSTSHSEPNSLLRYCQKETTPQRPRDSPQSQELINQKNKVIIQAAVSSPKKELVRNSSYSSMKSMSPRTAPGVRGAYVHVRGDGRPSIKSNPMYLQTDFDGPDDSMSFPQRRLHTEKKNAEGKNIENTNRSALTIGSRVEGEALKNQKVKRSESYRMANFSPLTTICDVNIDKDQGGGDVDLGVADLGEPDVKLCLSPVVPKHRAVTGSVRHVLNPNTVSRRIYGTQVMVRPNILLSLSPNRVTKPADTQKARVLSKSGISSELCRMPSQLQHQPQARHSAEKTSYIQNQPIYQNAYILGRENPSLNRSSPHQIANLHQRAVETKMEASPQRHLSLEGASRTIDAPLHSSTPTKPDSTLSSPLTVGYTFSPIERDVPQSRLLSSFRGEDNQAVAEMSRPDLENRKPSLLLAPKSTMTSEELYARIHKSKKQMNIKCEPEIILSPTSSVGSQSPVSSDRSTSPSSANEPKLAARSRHSWSPNSSKYVDVASTFDPRSTTPSPNLCLPKDHGLKQVTSTQDFKRLLLQHGTGTSGKSKLSAVERLKQAKQMATNVLSNNTSKFRFGSANSNSKSQILKTAGNYHLSSVTSKLAPSKSSIFKPGQKQWKFPDYENDVRSTPIMEDHREDEHALGGFEIQTLLASPMPARNVGRVVPNKQLTEGITKTTSPPLPYSESRTSAQLHQPPLSAPIQSVHPKQLRFGPTQVLPAAGEFDPLKSKTDCPAALETAL